MSNLIDAIKREDWGQIRNHLNEIKNKDEWSGWTVLHWACFCVAPIQAIQTLIKSDPQLVFETDRYEQTPLHVACSNLFSNSHELKCIVELLLESNPRAAFVKNCNNQTPLHLACSHSPLSIIKMIFEASPGAMLERDKDDHTPLDAFLMWDPMRSDLDDIVSFFLQMSPSCFATEHLKDKNLFRLIVCVSNTETLKKVMNANRDRQSKILEFLAHCLFQLREEIAKFSRAEISTEELLSEIRTGKHFFEAFTAKKIYALFSLILQLESNESLLISAIQNPSCPWLFCELILLLNPRLIADQSNFKQLPISHIDPKSKNDDALTFVFELMRNDPSCVKIGVENTKPLEKNES